MQHQVMRFPKLLEEADNLFKDQKFQEAQQIYETLVGMDPGNKSHQWIIKMFSTT